MIRIFLSIILLFFANVSYAQERDRVLEIGKMKEYLDWLSTTYRMPYDNQNLPLVIYLTEEELNIFFYGEEAYKKAVAEDRLVPVAGVFQPSPGSGVIYLRTDFDWLSLYDADIIVHELVHYLQHINGISYGCNLLKELDAYKYQSIWMIQNQSPGEIPTFLTAMAILEACAQQAVSE